METLLSKYEGWTLYEPRSARPQANMEVATIKAKKVDPLSKGGIRECVLMVVSNNNTQFEVMIPIEAWEHISKR